MRKGRYWRTVVTEEAECVRIPIQRVRCRSCHRSHALIYDFLIPYRKFTVASMGAACAAYLRGTSFLRAAREPVENVATVYLAMDSMLKKLPAAWMWLAGLLMARGVPRQELSKANARSNSWKCRKPGKAELLEWAARICELEPNVFQIASAAGFCIFSGRLGCELLRTHSFECALF